MISMFARSHLWPVVLVIAVMYSPAAWSDRCLTIDSVPHNIATSGHYCLSRDVLLASQQKSAFAILVTADNVVLDLKGYSVSGSGEGTGIAAMQRENLIIKNGTVNNFETGISLMSMRPRPIARNNVLRKLRMLGNKSIGIYSVGEHVLIEDNFIENTGSSENIRIPGYIPGSSVAIHSIGPGGVIRKNTIVGTNALNQGVAYGVYLDNCNDTVIEENTIIGQGSGVGVSYQSTCNVALKNNDIRNVTTEVSRHHSSKYR